MKPTVSQIADIIMDECDVDDIQWAVSAATKIEALVTDLWLPISEDAKKHAIVDLWAGEARFPNCFWVPDKNSWVRVTRYRDKDNNPVQFFNVVTNPTHYALVSPP